MITYQPTTKSTDRVECNTPRGTLGVKSLQAIVCTDTDRQQVQPRENDTKLDVLLWENRRSVCLRQKSTFGLAEM